MSITAEDIIEKYLEIYPLVEDASTSELRLYREGLSDIEKMYERYDITANERARYSASYITQTIATIASGAQQITLALIDRAFGMPSDIKYKEVQTSALEDSVVQNALIRVNQALSDMMGSMGAGGIVAPSSMIAANKESALKIMEILRLKGEPVFTETELSAIRNSKEEMTKDKNNIGG